MKQEILGITTPPGNCADKKCPFHGEINVKPEFLRGKVIRKDINRSATIEWNRPYYVPKYERYEIRRSRIRTHNPGCINAGIGHEVLVAKTRPLSKTKNHVILQIIGGEEITATVEKQPQKPVTKKKKSSSEVHEQ